MADLETAKTVLRGLRREVKEIEGGLFAISSRDQNFVIRGEEIDDYIARRPEIKRATETQMYLPGSYEHVVQFEGGGLRRPARRDEPLFVEGADGTRIEISRPSVLFCLCLTDVDQIDRELRRFALFPGNMRAPEDRVIGDLFRVPLRTGWTAQRV